MRARHYHLIGIGGTAMAGLAGLLLAKGYRVTGSDQDIYPPMSELLERLEIPVFRGYRPEHLQPHPDRVVIGNALSRGNPEIEYVLDAKLHYVSLPEVLKEEFIRGRHSVVIAGTHGKTTTTSLMAWALEQGGLRPSFLIGGIAENFETNFRWTESAHFVIEGDEYDTAFFDKGPKFLHYLPDTVILNAIEFDHADIYADLEAVKTAFRRLINIIPRRGRVIADFDSPVVREVVAGAWCPVHSFGTTPEAEWRAVGIRQDERGTRFEVRHGDRSLGEFVTPLIGIFNVRNCLAVIAAATLLGVEREALARALASFRSVRRRMEVKAEVAGITLIDDFAHHPTAVRVTLEALRQRYPDRRLIAVFEPRSRTSRLRIMQRAFEDALLLADVALIGPVFRPEVVPEDARLSPPELARALRERGRSAHAFSSVEEIVRHLSSRLTSGDVVVVFSNGDFGGIHEKLIRELRHREGATTREAS